MSWRLPKTLCTAPCSPKGIGVLPAGALLPPGGEDFWRSASLTTTTDLRNRKTFSYQWSSGGQAYYFSVSSHVRDINQFLVEPLWPRGVVQSIFPIRVLFQPEGGRTLQSLYSR